MIQIDENSIFNIIRSKRPHSVALNGPEPLLPKIQKVSENIEKEFNITSYIIGDRSWGSCDLNTQAADLLGADILFNIGHTISLENFGEKVFMIDAFDTVSFDNIALKCAIELKGRYKTISLVTDSQHLHQIENVKRIFEKKGYKLYKKDVLALREGTTVKLSVEVQPEEEDNTDIWHPLFKMLNDE